MQRITPDLVVCRLAVSVAWKSAWLRRQLCSGSLTSVIQAGVSSEGFAGEGSASNLMWLLAGISSSGVVLLPFFGCMLASFRCANHGGSRENQ